MALMVGFLLASSALFGTVVEVRLDADDGPPALDKRARLILAAFDRLAGDPRRALIADPAVHGELASLEAWSAVLALLGNGVSATPRSPSAAEARRPSSTSC